uniref:Uncharacterized protein n=1 Tax=Fagus sylvatica TaxID=28930 RepID=A0A2N9I5U2_FAGSY
MVAAKASSFKVLPDMMKKEPVVRVTASASSSAQAQCSRPPLLKGPVPPSAPNPGTHIPGSTTSHRKTPPPRTMPDGKVTSIP